MHALGATTLCLGKRGLSFATKPQCLTFWSHPYVFVSRHRRRSHWKSPFFEGDAALHADAAGEALLGMAVALVTARGDRPALLAEF
jgi:hypothetical protein